MHLRCSSVSTSQDGGMLARCPWQLSAGVSLCLLHSPLAAGKRHNRLLGLMFMGAWELEDRKKNPSDCSVGPSPALWVCLAKRLCFRSRGLQIPQRICLPVSPRNDSSHEDLLLGIRRKQCRPTDRAGVELPAASSCPGQSAS